MNSVTLKLGGLERPFQYRPGTSDEPVIRQIFTERHYDLGRLCRLPEIESFLHDLRRAGCRPLIVDAGANIGASSVYFALTVPDAQVVAVEPEPGNFAVLCANVTGLNVRCVRAALASHPGGTRLVGASGPFHTWGYRTDPAGPGPPVPTLTVARIFEEFGPPAYRPFLVKIDIEGGEKEVFAADTGWVRRTPLLVVELHDWLFPRQGTALPFLRCVAALDRDFVHHGENVFSIAHDLAGAG